MAPTKKTYKCAICSLSIGNQPGGIQCDVCLAWLHAGCVGIAEDDLSKFNVLDSISFICLLCKRNISSGDNGGLKGEIPNLNSKFDAKFNDLNNKFDSFITRGEDDRNFIKQAISEAVTDFRNEMSCSVKALKADITDSNKQIKQVETKSNDKFAAIENENNSLYLKFNRPDIVINGLPDCLKNIKTTIIDLASFYEISISPHDINLAFYTNNKRSVQVKFNSVFLRDEIMAEYYKTIKTQLLKASDFIVDPKIPMKLLDRRIFLNDHYSPAAGKLNATCLKLRQNKVINKFRIINSMIPKAVLTMPDNSVVERDLNGCTDMLKSIAE